MVSGSTDEIMPPVAGGGGFQIITGAAAQAAPDARYNIATSERATRAS
jgi:hypothetical protein